MLSIRRPAVCDCGDLAQPAGLFLQRHITTSAEMRDLRIVGAKRTERTGRVTHFVTTSG